MATGIKLKEFIECFCCNNPFERKTGHLMMCPDCEGKHPLCKPCYLSLKKEGKIIDKDYKREDLNERIRDKAK